MMVRLESSTQRSVARFATGAAVATAVALAWTGSFTFFHRDPEIERGRTLYAESCASCHGADLEGVPSWREQNPDGTFPPPPHDENGHTWHHDDAMLLRYVALGGQPFFDEMGVDFVSAMPAFGEQLTEEEIRSVLAYIQSTWPEEIQAAQAERTRAQEIE